MLKPVGATKANSRAEGQGLRLRNILSELARCYTPEPALTDPLAMIIWENVGYLISDPRRKILFDELALRVGREAAHLADAPSSVLFDIAQRGGMRPADRVERLRRVGRLALDVGGDLAEALRESGPAKARTILKRFPGIADPGADKILLFTGIEVRPALESNGVRALVRLGFAAEGISYPQSYRSAISALQGIGPPERESLVEAFQVLRLHGQLLCKRGAPICISCPIDAICTHTVTKSL